MEETGMARPERFRTGLVVLVAGAHFVHDVFAAFLAPLLPRLIDKHGLSLLSAGSLSVYTTLPSLLNPFLGVLVDRGGFHRLLVILGPGVTGVALCLVGVAPGYASLALLLLAAGCSLAGLHVAGPVLIGGLAGKRVGRGMSFFMAGGELARTLGPLLAAEAVLALTLEGLWQVAPLAVVSTLLIWWRLGAAREPRSAERPSGLLAVWRDMGRVFIAITGILVARSFMVGGLTVFLPTFLELEGVGPRMASGGLALLEAGGVVGVLASGSLSDRIGRRRVLLAAVLLSPPLLLAFLLSGGALRLAVLVPLGLVALSTTPVLLALTIEHAGANRAAATGTYMMVAFAARSLIVLAVGALGDAFGLHTTYLWCAGLAVLGLPFVLMLPPQKRGHS
jgi:FSR family fosmidomycin resistance protein-like MFS transporter